ncbi:MAG TPA: TetR family transcriptional regulator [Dysgonomonas sp.]|nr:TetR family transcriptional regulator [Dysgonomonas sp.]
MQPQKTTEEKIKEVARKIFMEKGYGLTRTRDIAEAAGINTALLNYYFRSKEKLFNIIIAESIKELFSTLLDIIENDKTDLSYKIDTVVNRYADVFLASPNLPLFVLSELQSQPELFFKQVGIPGNILLDSYFFRQLEEQLQKINLKIEPIHIFVNMIALTILPVIARPIMNHVHSMDSDGFSNFIEVRRKLVPIWIKDMLKLNN